jgi:hypothetical protein
MKTKMWAVALALGLAPSMAFAKTDYEAAKQTVKKAAKTTGDAVVDGGKTVGRSTKAFFKGGSDSAKKSWDENAGDTKRDAKVNSAATHDAAHGE